MELERILDGRKINLLFIDGDHSYGGAKSDFQMYGDFVARDGLIVFHDIMSFPETWGSGFDVGVLWRELKGNSRTSEIVNTEAPPFSRDPEQWERFGLPAYGFGLLYR